MDLSKLSDKDLEALSKNDLSSVSDEGLTILDSSQQTQSVQNGEMAPLNQYLSMSQGQQAQTKPDAFLDPINDINKQIAQAKTDISKFAEWGSNAISSLANSIPKNKEQAMMLAARAATSKELLPTAARVAPSLAIGLSMRQPTTIAGAAGQSGLMIPANLAGETLAQYVEWGLGGKQPTKESINAKVGSAIAASAPIYGGALKSAAAAVTLQTAGSLIDTGNLPDKKSAMISGSLGFGGGLLSRIGQGVQRSADAIDETAQQFASLGVKINDIPVHYLSPTGSSSSFRSSFVTGSSAAIKEAQFSAKMLAAAKANIADVSNVRVGGDIVSDLGEHLQGLNAAETAVAASSTDAATALANVRRAQSSLDQATKAGNSLESGAARTALVQANEQLNHALARDVQESVAVYAAGVGKTGSKVTPTNMKDYWETHVASRLEAYKSQQASIRFGEENLGFSPSQTLLTNKDISDAVSEAKKALGASNIEMPSISLPEGGDLSLSAIRDVRRQIADGAAWDAPAAQRRVFSAIGDRVAQKTRASIQRQFGETSLSNYDSANKWWRTISAAEDNPLGKSLFGRVVNDSALDSLTGNMVKGSADEYRAATSYINAVADGNPAMQAAMKKRLNSLVRDRLISDSSVTAASGTFQIDANKLLGNLKSVSRVNGLNVADLGFGSAEQLSTIRGALNKYAGASKLSSQELSDLYSKPEVIDALRLGNGLSRPVEEKVAEMVAKRRAYSAAVSAATGNTKGAAQDLAEANRLFSISGQSQTAAAAHLDQLNQSPLIQALSRGRTKSGVSFGISGASDDDFNKFTSYMLNSASGKIENKLALMAALEKENPLLRQEIGNRHLMNMLDDFAQTTNVGPNTTKALNYKKMDEFFTPLFSQNAGSESAMTKILIGDEAFISLSKMQLPVKRLADARRKLAGDSGFSEIANVAGAANMAATQSITGAFARRTGLRVLLDVKDSAGTAVTSLFLRNPTTFAIYKASGSIEKAIGSLPAKALAREVLINPELTQEIQRMKEQNQRLSEQEAQKSPQ